MSALLNDKILERWMSHACRAAMQGLNSCTPNPRVGCVLVGEQGQLIATGYHAVAGQNHAEAAALMEAGEAARGCTAFVTLEPCNHTGRTGPCTEALINAGVSRVVYGMQDPNPLVSGKGLARLQSAGIEVVGPVLEQQARALNPGFIKRMQTGLPFVRCKLAMSLDGRTAMASGDSKWITGPEARADVQLWRARSCAIITGVETVLYDNPSLTVRDERLGQHPRQPLRVVVDSRLRSHYEQKVYVDGQADTLIATTALLQPGKVPVEAWTLPSIEARVDLKALLARLAEKKQTNEVMVESGATLAGAFLQQQLVDELIIYVAPKIMGSAARPLFNWPIERMHDVLNLAPSDWTPFGRDWRLVTQPLYTDKLLDQALLAK